MTKWPRIRWTGAELRAKWWIAAGVLLAAAVLVVISVALRPSDADAEPRTTLISVVTETIAPYQFPVWWSDGQIGVELTQLNEGLYGRELLQDLGRTNDQLALEFESVRNAAPGAIAALPGGAGTPWVVVAFESKVVGFDDTTTTERPLVSVGTSPSGDGDQVQQLPVDIISNEVGGEIAVADAAVAEIAGESMALVTVSKNDEVSMWTCRIADCQWQEFGLPMGATGSSVASTHDGFVAVDDGDRSVWYADDTALSWRQVGDAPSDSNLVLAVDGPVEASLLWRNSLNQTLSVQTIRGGELFHPIEDAPPPADYASLSALLSVDGEWYLGGSTASAASIDLRYQTNEARIWRYADQGWIGIDDRLMTDQVDQNITALFWGQDSLHALSSSAVLDIRMVWRVDARE